MQKRILAFVYDEDGGWSTGEWAVITAGAVAIGVGLYQHLEVTYQDDTTVFFAIDQDDTNLATKAVNAYRRMFMRARGCFGYGLTAGGDLDALGNAGDALHGSEAYRQKTDPYCNPA